jgi:hypothetical protein
METYTDACNGVNTWLNNRFGLIYSDGVERMCERLECFWLIDQIITSYVPSLQKLWQEHGLLLVCLTKTEGTAEAVFTVTVDIDTPPLIIQVIPYTDIPMNVKLYWEIDRLFLPDEY